MRMKVWSIQPNRQDSRKEFKIDYNMAKIIKDMLRNGTKAVIRPHSSLLRYE